MAFSSAFPLQLLEFLFEVRKFVIGELFQVDEMRARRPNSTINSSRLRCMAGHLCFECSG